MEALGAWYEPRLTALLQRQQLGEDTLRKVREQGVDLKSSMAPMRAELQRLEARRVCLEQRLMLMGRERERSVAEYQVQKSE